MITVANDRCDFCGTCVAVCPADCIDLYEARIEIVQAKCIDCMLCVWICPVETLAFREPDGAAVPAARGAGVSPAGDAPGGAPR